MSPPSVRWSPVAVSAAVLPLIVGGIFLVGSASDPDQAWTWLVGVLSALLGWRLASVRAVAGTDALELRGVWRERRISWAEVVDVQVEHPRWLKIAFWRFGGGTSVRVVLADDRSLTPLALCTTIEYERVDAVVRRARQQIQAAGRSTERQPRS